ncbi:MAG: hypothetical protein V1897_01195 [Pseudomonadota bacterium]
MYSYELAGNSKGKTTVTVKGKSPLHFEEGETLVFRHMGRNVKSWQVGNVIAVTNSEVPGIHVQIVEPCCDQGDIIWTDGTPGFPMGSDTKVFGYLVDRFGPNGERKHVPHPPEVVVGTERHEILAESFRVLREG